MFWRFTELFEDKISTLRLNHIPIYYVYYTIRIELNVRQFAVEFRAILRCFLNVQKKKKKLQVLHFVPGRRSRNIRILHHGRRLFLTFMSHAAPKVVVYVSTRCTYYVLRCFGQIIKIITTKTIVFVIYIISRII